MNIVVVGAGYVGLSNALLLAQKNNVTLVEIDQNKVDLINAHKSPIVDKEIEEFLSERSLHLNTVTDSELGVFVKVLNDNSISYELFDTLEESLVSTFNNANESDVILLLGAQGMDPARQLLEQNDII